MRLLMWEPMLVLMLFVACQNAIEPDICMTQQCSSTADMLLRWLNMSVNACDNFHEFACGGRKNSRSPPSDSNHLYDLNASDHLWVIRDALAEELKPTDYDALQKAKKLYTSCINHTREDDDTIVNIINDKFGHWPLTCDSCFFDEYEFDVITMLVKAMFLGAHPFFSLKAGHHGVYDKDGIRRERRRLYIDKPELVWSFNTNARFKLEQRYLNRSAIKIYTYAKRFGVINDTHAQEEAMKIANAEHILTQYYDSDDQDSIVQAENLTIGTLYKDYGKLLNWKRLIPSIAESRPLRMTNVGLNEIVYVATPASLKKADEYFSTLSPRTLANFIIWRVIETLDSVVNKEDLTLSAVVAEIPHDKKTPRSDPCAAYVSKEFHLVAHKLLYEAYDSLQGVYEVVAIADKLQTMYRLIIFTGWKSRWWKHEKTTSDWGDKIRNLKITFFDFFKYNFQLDQIYKNVYINESNFILNVAALNKAAFIRDFKSIRLLNKFENRQPPHEFQAKYDMYQNKIAYSATAFKPPLLTDNVTLAVDYAGLGFSIAREMIQAFNYMANRNYNDMSYEDWLKQNTTFRSYFKPEDCALYRTENKHYTVINKTVIWKKVNGDIADSAGFRLAHLTWRDLESLKSVKSLPRVHFSDEQVFFIKYAQTVCALEDKMAAKNKEDHYNQAKFRVIGSLGNTDDFARVFKCPEGSWMNPLKACPQS